jgi:hypothetical protein
MYGAIEHIKLFASAARTAAHNSDDQYNKGHRGLKLTIDATAEADTAEVTFTLQGKDQASGKYYTILASAAISAVGTTVLTVYPGITAAANVSVSDVLPAIWRVAVTVADADSLTYSVGVDLLP